MSLEQTTREAHIARRIRLYDLKPTIILRPLPKPPAPEIVVPEPPFPANMHGVLCATAYEYCVPLSILTSPTRKQRITRARQVAMYLMHHLLPGKSFPQIARKAGRKDHTTALHAVRITTQRRRADPLLAERIKHITDSLMGAP